MLQLCTASLHQSMRSTDYASVFIFGRSINCEWRILILVTLGRNWLLSVTQLLWSPVVFLDHWYQGSWNFFSIIPVDVARGVAWCGGCSWPCVYTSVSLDEQTSSCSKADDGKSCWHALKWWRSGCGQIVYPSCALWFSPALPYFPYEDFTAFARDLVSYSILLRWVNHALLPQSTT